MISHRDLILKLKATTPEIEVPAARVALASDEPPALVDVRQADEVAQGIIEGAVCIPLGVLEFALPSQLPDPQRPVIFCCASGNRSVLAASRARDMGYTRATSLQGGFSAWKQTGAPFHLPPAAPRWPLETEPPRTDIAPAWSPQALQRALSAPAAPVVIDVREEHEWASGVIPQARLIPRGLIEDRVGALLAEADGELVLVSGGDRRATMAAASLGAMGWSRVGVLSGGMDAWRAAGQQVAPPDVLDQGARLRYSRHLLLPEVGVAGQRRLLNSRVLLVGVGGLGSPAAFYLAAAGVGHLGLVDSDRVDRSNLQRQILHRDDRVGAPKVDSGRAALLALNPDIEVKTFDLRLTADNALEVMAGYDVVIDGGDNFPTRYLVNDACVRLGIPCVHGSVYRFEGQLAVFAPHLGGPCYRCLHPSPPAPGAAPSCGEAGVLGVVPGVVGMLQANEAIKLLLGLGAPLVGRLALFDALGTTLRQLRLPADPACPVCGPHINPQDIALEATDPACAAR